MKPVFVAATGQHVGKTTTCLGLLTGLRKHFPDFKVNYMKPVGQKHRVVDGKKVDKDVVLFKNWFDLAAPAPTMSPVVVPNGYTRDYIDGKYNRQDQLDNIKTSFDSINTSSDMVLLEGTGHSGVGSVIEVNNAQVAANLGARVVLIGTGGLGSSFDELELNRLAFEHYGVEIAGVVLNKCMPSKINMLRDYFTRLLADRWGDVPLLGLVPTNPFLTQSTLADLKNYLSAEQIAGEAFNDCHYDSKTVLMVATDLTRFLQKQELNQRESPLFLSHVSRNDIILGYLSHWQKCKARGISFRGALILAAGSTRVGKDREIQSHVLDTIKAMDVPVFVVNANTFQIMQKLDDFTPKLHYEDTGRVRVACDHVCEHIDFKLLAERLKS
mmetsp:Transcript_12556/g.18968  ORF Transcript_12556/g.18968 Transcript_12556/m.18968 type:complete len:384 (-) Transcript_12556:134-1285(-)